MPRLPPAMRAIVASSSSTSCSNVIAATSSLTVPHPSIEPFWSRKAVDRTVAATTLVRSTGAWRSRRGLGLVDGGGEAAGGELDVEGGAGFDGRGVTDDGAGAGADDGVAALEDT